ncbi:MAG: LptF/LptG family permease [Pelagibacteraceae bacterium]|nr:LptF/LptG family permease [Pelagibacteraceae bacterium]MCI5079027.1 LptF/LptG family permease [Pelagibacteraceae bacterium]
MVKNKIFTYIILEYFKIFLIISLSFSLLIWMTQAARLLELITEFGNSISVYSLYLFFNYPKILNNIYLLSFALSFFFLYAKLESSKELNIYWFSGISKKKIIKVSFIIGLLAIIFQLILSVYITPLFSAKGRQILGQSKFSLINSLVKEKNFNSPLKGLTIYVDANDQKGNLNGVFIYEKTRTIIAKRGEVISSDGNSYLKLYDGITHEKVDENINTINFKNTIFDFSKYQLQNIIDLKFSERSTYWLFQNLRSANKKANEIREEFNKRIISPLFTILVCVACGFLLYSNNEKINLKKYKLLIYTSVILSLIINQILIGLSGESIKLSILYFFLIIFSIIFLYLSLVKLINSEVK